MIIQSLVATVVLTLPFNYVVPIILFSTWLKFLPFIVTLLLCYLLLEHMVAILSD